MLAKLASVAIKGAVKAVAKLGPFFSKAKAFFVGLVPFAELIITWLDKKLADPLLTKLLSGMRRLVGWAAARWFAEDETNRAAFILMWDQLAAAFRDRYAFTIWVTGGAAAVLLLTVGAPLLYRYARRRRLRVFISFHRSKEKIAADLEATFRQGDLTPERLPYRPDASHQAVVEGVSSAIQHCDSMVCVAGADHSFVDSEVMSATTLGKAVVFLVAEDAGTLPDTANKRHPMFKLERTREHRFEPLISFLHYIGADFHSLLQLTRRAMAHPFMAVPLYFGLAVAILGGGAMWGGSYMNARDAGLALVGSATAGLSGRTAAVSAHAVILASLAVVIVFVSAYVALVIFNMVRQRRTQRRAMLKTASAAFARDDWTDSVPDLAKGSVMYDCMLEASALAHHESRAHGSATLQGRPGAA